MDVVMERDRVQYLGGGGNVLAEVTFPQVEPGVAEINHTFVDESLRGRGVAGELMGRAVASIVASGLAARPTCSYAVSWFEKHPERAALIA
ncbi:MAG TPA: N-acetyltransferase [Candidatus Olsenella avistercoris]|nr:N-acetyltransferase [Candidatus Olsenella avistercoris]